MTLRDIDDVSSCVARAHRAWIDTGEAQALTHLTPDDINRFQQVQHQLFLDWLAASVSDKGQPDDY